MISPHLFKALFKDWHFVHTDFHYSPDAGQKIFKVIDINDDIIDLFETSSRGYFAFGTRSKKVGFH